MRTTANHFDISTNRKRKVGWPATWGKSCVEPSAVSYTRKVGGEPVATANEATGQSHKEGPAY